MQTSGQSSISTQHWVTKALLDLHDKYDGDLGLLDERWASKQDREAFSSEPIRMLGEYIDQLQLAQVGRLAPDYRIRVEERIIELEQSIVPEVIEILKGRLTQPTKTNRGE